MTGADYFFLVKIAFTINFVAACIFYLLLFFIIII